MSNYQDINNDVKDEAQNTDASIYEGVSIHNTYRGESGTWRSEGGNVDY